MNLLTLAPTVSETVAGGLIELNGQPRNITAQVDFVWGSGGTTVDVYLQTSLDDGATWSDIANFHLTTAPERKAVNLSALTPNVSQIGLTNGSMSSNTAQDGILGTQFRCLVVVVGTYVASMLTVDVQSDQLPK
jgi:hypothetical protein